MRISTQAVECIYQEINARAFDRHGSTPLSNVYPSEMYERILGVPAFEYSAIDNDSRDIPASLGGHVLDCELSIARRNFGVPFKLAKASYSCLIANRLTAKRDAVNQPVTQRMRNKTPVIALVAGRDPLHPAIKIHSRGRNNEWRNAN